MSTWVLFIYAGWLSARLADGPLSAARVICVTTASQAGQPHPGLEACSTDVLKLLGFQNEYTAAEVVWISLTAAGLLTAAHRTLAEEAPPETTSLRLSKYPATCLAPAVSEQIMGLSRLC